MFKKAALLTLAASAHAFAIPSDGAEARAQAYVVGHVYYARPHVHHHRIYRARPFVYEYVATPYVATPYLDGEGCYWLKRRAIATSSPYWWQRYRWCRGD